MLPPSSVATILDVVGPVLFLPIFWSRQSVSLSIRSIKIQMTLLTCFWRLWGWDGMGWEEKMDTPVLWSQFCLREFSFLLLPSLWIWYLISEKKSCPIDWSWTFILNIWYCGQLRNGLVLKEIILSGEIHKLISDYILISVIDGKAKNRVLWTLRTCCTPKLQSVAKAKHPGVGKTFTEWQIASMVK